MGWRKGEKGLGWGCREGRDGVLKKLTRKPPLTLPIPQPRRLRLHPLPVLPLILGSIRDIDGKNAAGGGDESDFAEGGGECGEELLCEL